MFTFQNRIHKYWIHLGQVRFNLPKWNDLILKDFCPNTRNLNYNKTSKKWYRCVSTSVRNKWNSKLHFSPPLSNIVFVHGTGNIRRSFFPPTYMQRKSHSSPAVRSPFKLLNTSVNFRIISIAILCSALLLSTINKKERRFSPFRNSKGTKNA